MPLGSSSVCAWIERDLGPMGDDNCRWAVPSICALAGYNLYTIFDNFYPNSQSINTAFETMWDDIAVGQFFCVYVPECDDGTIF